MSEKEDRQLTIAYSVCRGIARAQAKNFYWGFRVLPRSKRDALCAVYAFMRHADDLADDPGLSLDQRREQLAAWRDSLHQGAAGERSDDPVLLAISDTQQRYEIPLEYFDQLIYGTVMDLQFASASADEPAVPYRTFDELAQYCYHVASVVGLVCIHIFGFDDPRAKDLAIHTGLAFQLTNILRDVREDAAMGRVYLPAEDLEHFGRSPHDLARKHLVNGFDVATFKPLLEFEAQRARDYYKAADELITVIHEDSRACLWTLVTMYRRLLARIAGRDYNIFAGKVRLPLHEKLAVFSRGLVKAVLS